MTEARAFSTESGLLDAPRVEAVVGAVQVSRHARQQSKTDQQISFRNR